MRRDTIETCFTIILALLVVAASAHAARTLCPQPLDLRLEEMERRIKALEDRTAPGVSITPGYSYPVLKIPSGTINLYNGYATMIPCDNKGGL